MINVRILAIAVFGPFYQRLRFIHKIFPGTGSSNLKRACPQ